MTRNQAVLIVLFVTFLSQDAFACRFAPGYQTFELSSTRLPDTEPIPTTPTMAFLSIKRGTDDRDFASCSDAGILTITVTEPEAVENKGFLFELESGSFPDSVLPETIVSPIELEDGSMGFYFVWLDLPAGTHNVDPIDARISIRAVSPTMVEGPKVFIEVRDP